MADEFLGAAEEELGLPKMGKEIKNLLPAEPPYMPLPGLTKSMQEKIPLVGGILKSMKGVVKMPGAPTTMPGKLEMEELEEEMPLEELEELEEEPLEEEMPLEEELEVEEEELGGVIY
jgi:hypothetical protein